jgi:hypothetical protein
MATIDPSIAMGYKPVQIENPINQMAAYSQLQGAQNQNALAQYQLSAAQRADESTNIQNQLYAKHYDPTTGRVNTQGLYGDLAKSPVTAGLIPKLQAQEAELKYKQDQGKKIVSEISKLNFETGSKIFSAAQDELKQIDPRSPDAAAQYLAYRKRLYANPELADFFSKTGLTEQATNAQVMQAIKTPQGLADAILKSMTTADQFQKILQDREQLKVSQGQLGVAQGNLGVNQQQLQLAQQRLANETNPVLQGELAAAKKRAEENVKFETQGRIDIAANRKALKQAGYDPITGEDDITKLIEQSTGGYLGKGLDIGARVFGSATEGSKALAQLEQKGNAITFGLLNGKLGAGISTSDRQFIEALVSRISDGTLPVEDRLAAWTSAKDMMRTLGMVEPPTKSGSPKPSAAPSNQTKSGATVSNW